MYSYIEEPTFQSVGFPADTTASSRITATDMQGFLVMVSCMSDVLVFILILRMYELRCVILKWFWSLMLLG